jgi:RNA polymerase sigma-70 factor (ECF subfamily)
VLVIIVILSDNEFQSLKNGDKDVYIRLYNEYKKPVYHLILSKISVDREAAEDILQDTFLAALNSLSRLKNPAHIDAWLITIAKNKVVDYFRKRGTSRKYEPIVRQQEEGRAASADELAENERVALLRLGMERLNAGYRELLTMRCREDMSVKDIAEKLKRTPKAVENMLLRAKDSLKKEIGRLSRESDG